MKDVHVGKNVGFKLRNLMLVQQYMNKTRQNFSKTLNIIIEEWDRYSIEIEKLRRAAEYQKTVDNAKTGEVIKK